MSLWAVQSQEQASTLKFWIYEEEVLHYLRRENKGADLPCSRNGTKALFQHNL